jgi:hypothetical protein
MTTHHNKYPPNIGLKLGDFLDIYVIPNGSNSSSYELTQGN